MDANNKPRTHSLLVLSTHAIHDWQARKETPQSQIDPELVSRLKRFKAWAARKENS